MSTHNIPFSIQKENHTKLSQICAQGIFFLGTQGRVRNSHGKRTISVRATQVLLYSEVSTFHLLDLPLQYCLLVDYTCEKELLGCLGRVIMPGIFQ